MTTQYPILVGDIGGTNARFALLTEGGLELLPKALTADHADPVAAIQASLQGVSGALPRSAVLAVAGPITSPRVHLTNAAWLVDAEAIGRALGLDRVTLVNDFVPVAAALAVLGREQLEPLGAAPEPGPGPRLVLGPGTGLGAAALIPLEGGHWLIQPTEAGHVEFGPVDEDETALWPYIERVGGRVTAEVVLSGPGLHRLYRALCARGGAGGRCEMPADVVDQGLSGEDGAAAAAVRLFARLLGRFAGDLALVFGASGGVYIAGGIAPRIAPLLTGGAFREAFERKAPFAELMHLVPAWLITESEPALAGLAALARAPGRFLFPQQSWMAGP